ncbi:hypothetical protein CTI12_AA464730 [Artemisia annua]|uniref:Helitron helicase-like domain-containing protein n=1 Tax=Artemisia annua TaxID=35608 RepID=A0A2U1LQL6_ARTAN|nr:hypothetical protein CTI12_AA464730 [Artemisia annua]
MKVKKKVVRRVSSIGVNPPGCSANVIVSHITRECDGETPCSSQPLMTNHLGEQLQANTSESILSLLEQKNTCEPTSMHASMGFETYERVPSILNGGTSSVHGVHGEYSKVDVMPYSSAQTTGKRKMHEVGDTERPFAEGSTSPVSSPNMHDLLLNEWADTNESELLCSEDFTVMESTQAFTDAVGCSSHEVEQVAATNATPFSYTASHSMSTTHDNLHTQNNNRQRRSQVKQVTTANSHSVSTPNDNLHTQNNNPRRRSQVRMHSSRRRQQRPRVGTNGPRASRQGPPTTYVHMGRCDRICRHCNALFWYAERIASNHRAAPEYHRCCNAGKVRLERQYEYPQYIKQLFTDRHFLENIRAYNQMFAMTSIGAEIDNSVNNGRGPYVFKVSGQIYHFIGSMCPETGARPKFLQLYIYDTETEVANRLEKFQRTGDGLRADIVENLIGFLDEHNELVKLFRTARDKMTEADIPSFKIQLFGVVGSRQHELPSGDSIGAIVFQEQPDVYM